MKTSKAHASHYVIEIYNKSFLRKFRDSVFAEDPLQCRQHLLKWSTKQVLVFSGPPVPRAGSGPIALFVITLSHQANQWRDCAKRKPSGTHTGAG